MQTAHSNEARKQEIIRLSLGAGGSMLGLCAVVAVQRYVILALPLGIRMAAMIAVYWLAALAPLLIMRRTGDTPEDVGFRKERLSIQILVGIGIGIVMALLPLICHLLGFGENWDNGRRYVHLWQFAYEFLYCIAAIGAVEEIVFRGFVYRRFLQLSGREGVAVIGSSILFGLFHLLNGSVVQVLATGCLGAVFCLWRLKLRNCTLLSLIVAHGVYDALISVMASLFL